MELGKFLLICLGASIALNFITMILYFKLLKQTKDIRTFSVNTLDTIFYRDPEKLKNLNNK